MAFATSYHAGALRSRVTIRRKAITGADITGAPVEGFVSYLTSLPAKITPTKGGEEVQAARLAGQTLYDVVVRGSPEIAALTSADVLVNEATGETWNILDSFDVSGGKGAWSLILCKSGVAV